MNVKVAISNYGSSQLKYLASVIEGFRRNKRHRFDITVYSTVHVEYPHVLHDHSIGKGLTFTHRKDMIRALPDYDLFIYDENDHLITEDNIEAFLEHSRSLPEGTVSGFLQFEMNPNGKKTLVALNYGLSMRRFVKKRTATAFIPQNLHQGCWVLLQKDLGTAIKSGGFATSPHTGPYGELEQGASDPYTQCGLKKVLPLDYALCERLLIHHLPDKYVRFSQWGQHGVDLRTLFDEHMNVGEEGI